MLRHLIRFTLLFLLPALGLSGAGLSISAVTGQSAVFTARAQGTAPFTYQWYKNGTPITGASSVVYQISVLSLSDSANYTVKVSSPYGSAESAVAELSVKNAPVAPAIVEQPVPSQTVEGETAVFSVKASGTAPLYYAWYKDGNPLPNENTDTLRVYSTTTADAADYKVSVSNVAGSTTSIAARLQVLKPILPAYISRQPSPQTSTEGQSVSFSIEAQGTAPFTYQWFKDGEPIPSATSTTLTLSKVTQAQAGIYFVTVANPAGGDRSESVTLKVTPPSADPESPPAMAPAISRQPDALAVGNGQSASFSVVATGTAPLSYQWYKDNSPLPGATSALLSLQNCTDKDLGAYVVVVTNSAGSASSLSVRLTLKEITAPPSILTQPASLIVAVGQPATFSVEASGSAPFTYQWYKASVPIQGATAPSYTIKQCSNTDASVYAVTVYNAAGSATSKNASLTVDTTLIAPRISTQPASTSVALGKPAVFVVKASGTAPFSYQWKKDGVAIAGATADSLTLSEVQSSDEGSYSVTVSNRGGSVQSTAASLLVTQPPSPKQSRICNLSIRSVLDSAKGPMMIGFNVSGGAKSLLIRATGPALAAFGVQGTLEDPRITLYSGGVEVAANDNWGDLTQAGTLRAAFDQVGAFGIADSSSKDAALIASVDGLRSVHVHSAKPNARGVVLLELYDRGTGVEQRLTNISVNNYAGTGADSLILGFTLDGPGTKRILLRGVGPGLAQFGVQGYLKDPRIELHGLVNGQDQILATNENWQDDPKTTPAFSQSGAFSLPDASKDAAIVLELPAGAYSALVSGADNGTGTALVEVYELP